MGVHSLEEWAELYKKKTHNDFKPHPNFRLIFFPERGFCEVAFEPKVQMVMAYQLCGDGKFWKRVLDALAMAAGYEHCGAGTSSRICGSSASTSCARNRFLTVRASTMARTVRGRPAVALRRGKMKTAMRIM